MELSAIKYHGYNSQQMHIWFLLIWSLQSREGDIIQIIMKIRLILMLLPFYIYSFEVHDVAFSRYESKMLFLSKSEVS